MAKFKVLNLKINLLFFLKILYKNKNEYINTQLKIPQVKKIGIKNCNFVPWTTLINQPKENITTSFLYIFLKRK